MKRITILGATGTIGVNTLDVISRNRDRYQVFALTANENHARLAEQCRAWRPRFAVMADASAAEQLSAALVDVPETEVLAGVDALVDVAAHADTDYVMAGIVGAAGLQPTLAAAQAGKRVLLANKEALVMSGALFMDAVRQNGAELLPIDSEHNAIFQCMPTGAGSLDEQGVRRILLTASGGPFRTTPVAQLASVTPAQAVAHPNWVMGRKISVDSASMMNKGLEIIEACWLFDTTVDRIEVVIHPQSIIHSMVEYADGSILAQMGNPDMRTPIAHAMAWPARHTAGVDFLQLTQTEPLAFEEPDLGRFPCLRLAFEAAAAGGHASAVLNAANEVAVAAFLDGKLRFTDIPVVIEQALASVDGGSEAGLDAVLAADRQARAVAERETAQRQVA